MTTSRLSGRIPVAIACVLFIGDAGAHHSPAAFDVKTTVEYEGIVKEVLPVHPHSRVFVSVQGSDGKETVWELELVQPNILRTRGIDLSALKPGEHVRFAGHPRRNGDPEMILENLLTSTGLEWVVEVDGGKPRWSKLTVGYQTPPLEGVKSPEAAKRGIFRVWQGDGALSVRQYYANLPKLPYTEKGRELFEGFPAMRAKLQASPEWKDCFAWGMPGVQIFEAMSPFEFINQGKTITVRWESTRDQPRVIHMDGKVPNPLPPLSDNGYSVGHWEGTTLVVKTTRIVEHPIGLPYQSDRAELVERFTPSADGSKLDYQVVVTDPVMFTAPVTHVQTWYWSPDRNKVVSTPCVEMRHADKATASKQ